MGESNPYQTQTSQNLVVKRDEDGRIRSDGFDAGEKDVDVHPDGVSKVISNLGIVKDNFTTERDRTLPPLRDLPRQALGVKGYPDGVAAMRVILENQAELAQYGSFLEAAYENVRMMLQTMKDSVGGKDSFSAITLDAVNFAAVQPGAKRPDGLPTGFKAKTWMNAYTDMVAKQNAPGAAADSNPALSQWSESGKSTSTDGSTTTYFTDQLGNHRSVMTMGGTTVTTIIDKNGNATQTKEVVTYNGTDKVTTTSKVDDPFGTKPKETVTGSEKVSTTSNLGDGQTVTTTDLDAKGKPTDSTTVTTHGDGSTDTTRGTYDKNGKETDDPTLHVGADTPAPKRPESPVPAALKSIK